MLCSCERNFTCRKCLDRCAERNMAERFLNAGAGNFPQKIITVHLSPYQSWQGYEDEMPEQVRRVYKGGTRHVR